MKQVPSRTIYLDNNATTKVAPEVVHEMSPFFTELYANPSSLHFFGKGAMEEIIKAKEIISKQINCNTHEIIFTSSGSESNNLCIKGFCEANRQKGKHIITSVIEHPAVLNSCKHLAEQGFSVTSIGVDHEGFINPLDIERAIREDTILVSIMHVNNEIGSIQNIKEISEICQKHSIAFHTDAVQSFLKMPFDVKEYGISMASFSGHKIHAPKGVGFVYIKDGLDIRRQIDGGGQEFNLRSGTENIPYIVGLTKAIQISSDHDIKTMKKIQNYLLEKVQKIPGIKINGPTDLSKRVCNNINISSNRITGEILAKKLSENSICVSTGSACSSGLKRVSPVLISINCPTEYLQGNIRISISRYTTLDEINVFINSLEETLIDV